MDNIRNKKSTSFGLRRLFLGLWLGCLSCNYLVVGPEFISGREANTRITGRIVLKLSSCGLLNYTFDQTDTNPDPWRRSLSGETNNILFLLVQLLSRFEVFSQGYAYKSEDIDRCSKDIEYFSCDQFQAGISNDPNFGIFIGSLICKDVQKFPLPLDGFITSRDREGEKER